MTAARCSDEDGLAATVASSRGFRSLYDCDVDNRTETQSIESDAEPAAVVALLADPSRIPDWVPAFADAVAGDDQSGWRVTKDGQDFTVRVVTKRDAGTVDYLREIAQAGKAEHSSEWYRVLAVAVSSS